MTRFRPPGFRGRRSSPKDSYLRRLPMIPAETESAEAALRQDMVLEDHVLTFNLAKGEEAFIRRSSLIYAGGAFRMTTRRIASRRLPIIGLFSGQNLWANRFEAEGEAELIAGRDFHGTVLGIDVSEDEPVWLQPALYLGHRGGLDFTVQRVAKREFWTLTRVTGSGRVWIKAPGRTFLKTLSEEVPVIVDTNYVAAVRKPFKAHGRVFSAGQYLKSGEAENVRLSGSGDVLIQTELPPQEGGGGGPLGFLLDLFT